MPTCVSSLRCMPCSTIAPGQAFQIPINRRPGFSSKCHTFGITRRRIVPAYRIQNQRRCILSASTSTQAATAVPSAPLYAVASNGGVLFDMDGVLCCTQELSASVACRVIKELCGAEVQPAELEPYRGRGEAALLVGIADKYGKSLDADAATQRFLDLYIEGCQTGSDVAYPGSADVVQSCRAAGLKVAIASSAAVAKVEVSLAACGLSLQDFDAVVAGDAVANLKPAPDVFLEAALRLGLEPSQCVVVEDSPVGIQAAAAAGMKCIAVATSGLPQESLEAQGAAVVRAEIGRISVEDVLSQLPHLARLAIISSSSAAAEAPQGWLEQPVQLPAGYRTTRRELLKLLPLAGGIGCIWVAATRAKAMSLGSPKAFLKALFPDEQPPAAPGNGSERVQAFVRYIDDLEKRGGGEVVPEFQPGLDWLNAPPLRLSKELSGKVVVLDFWTYCCINCMHVLPDLAAVEGTFEGQPVAVVGVHSAKFDNEKDSEAIRNAVLRYDVVHPVVNDGAMSMWGALGVSSWPTLVIVSPRGRVIARLAGEGHRQDLQDFVGAALQYYGPRGLLDNTPVPQALEKDKAADLQGPSPLRYPGKLAVDLEGGRLFVADSNNHRIVFLGLDGKFLGQVGGNGPAMLDGSFEAAAFNRLQGLAYSHREDALYVADTENHALRRVDLRAQRVDTLAGNGVKGSDYQGGRTGGAQQLNSPWDVVLDSQEQKVLIAMAGQHQIWQYNTASGICSNLSGTGYERNQNGPTFSTTSWAQPSGLSFSSSGREVYVADSESSAVRVLDLATGGSRLLAGGDPLFSDNLFRFGDQDGVGSKALLQHPLAVCTAPDGLVYVADSYNHKLKVLDPSTGAIRTLAGDGQAGFRDGPLGATGGTRLSEPSGMVWAGEGKLLVADTNNSAIRIVDLKAGQLSTLKIEGVPGPRVDPTSVDPRGGQVVVPAGAKVVRGAAVAATSGSVNITITLPDGYHLTAGANSSFTADAVRLSGPSSSPSGLSVQPSGGALNDSLSLSVSFYSTADGNMLQSSSSAASGGADAAVRVVAKVYFCKDDDACLFEQVCFLQPVLLGAGGVAAVNTFLQHECSLSAPVLSPL